MLRLPLLVLALITLAAGAVLAQPGSPVDCGPTTCFVLKVTVEGRTPDQRATEATNVINKYLGGNVGKVTTQPAGKSVKLLLNSELVTLVTPQDAAIEKEKTAAALAARWRQRLEAAFEETKAQP